MTARQHVSIPLTNIVMILKVRIRRPQLDKYLSQKAVSIFLLFLLCFKIYNERFTGN